MPVSEQIMLARHGETEWSRSGRHTGRTDIPLTDEGRRQAEALRPALAGLDPALVLTSPLARAAETCRLAGLGEVAEEEPALMEWDYGDYEGLTSDQIHEDRPGWNVFDDGVPGGETPDQVAARVDGVIERMAGAGGLCVAFAHGHVLRVLGARWIELPPAAGARLGLSTATVSALGTEHDVRALARWNAAP
jgi:broad specificity phosphatase PhoE